MTTLEYLFDKYKLEDAPIIKLNCSRKGTIPRMLRRLGFKLGVEMGVERAVYSKILCRGNPKMKLYGVDAWQVYEGYRDHVDQDRLDEFYLATKRRMAECNFEAVREFSVKAARRFEDGSLDFVYIDGAHEYESVYQDIRAWAPKVRKDGLVIGHDYFNGTHTGFYGTQSQYGVKAAVLEWINEQNIKPLFLFNKDKFPSWMYVQS